MCELHSGQRDERGAAAVEYAVVTVAAASLGGALVATMPTLRDPLLRFTLWLLGQLMRLFGMG